VSEFRTINAGAGKTDLGYWWAASGDDTLTAGAETNDILFGSSGTTAYRFGSSFGRNTVNNAGSANMPAGCR
jgi:hypothetical protein